MMNVPQAAHGASVPSHEALCGRAIPTTLEVRETAELEAITRADVNVALLRRPIAPSMHEAMTRFAHGAAFSIHARLEDPSSDAIDALLEGLRAGPARDRIRDDVAILSSLYRRLTGSIPRVGVEVVDHDACRKFHHDFVGLRLLVTYLGPGTEWLEEPHVDRSHLGRHDLDIETCNARIAPHPEATRRAEPGDVLILKGAAYPGNAAHGAVHRSPPIQGTGIRRVVMKIDDLDCGC